MEVEIIACHLKEKFALYYINWLIDSDFDKKPWKSCTLIPISLIGPQLAAIPLAPA